MTIATRMAAYLSVRGAALRSSGSRHPIKPALSSENGRTMSPITCLILPLPGAQVDVLHSIRASTSCARCWSATPGPTGPPPSTASCIGRAERADAAVGVDVGRGAGAHRAGREDARARRPGVRVPRRPVPRRVGRPAGDRPLHRGQPGPPGARVRPAPGPVGDRRAAAAGAARRPPARRRRHPVRPRRQRRARRARRRRRADAAPARPAARHPRCSPR